VIEVIVAEPNLVLRIGIKAVLEKHAEIAIVGEAVTVEAFRAAFLAIPHDVVLVEMGLLKSIGSAALRELRLARPASRFLVHSYEKDTDFGAEAFKFGATGYVANDCSPVELCAAVSKVAAGHPFITPALGVDLATAVCFRATNLAYASLNARERRVFKMLAIGLKDSTVARQMGTSLLAVQAHKKRIMAKMHLPGESELVQFAISQSVVRRFDHHEDAQPEDRLDTRPDRAVRCAG
jgi:DNA-binding NarL/FixJ family response regulator